MRRGTPTSVLQLLAHSARAAFNSTRSPRFDPVTRHTDAGHLLTATTIGSIGEVGPALLPATADSDASSVTHSLTRARTHIRTNCTHCSLVPPSCADPQADEHQLLVLTVVCTVLVLQAQELSLPIDVDIGADSTMLPQYLPRYNRPPEQCLLPNLRENNLL